jgi:hypothetical protein
MVLSRRCWRVPLYRNSTQASLLFRGVPAHYYYLRRTRILVFKILSMGGYGNVGRPITRVLLQYAPSHVHAPSDCTSQLVSFRNENPLIKSRIISRRQVDGALDEFSLRQAFFQDVDTMVLVASSTTTFAQQVVNACSPESTG